MCAMALQKWVETCADPFLKAADYDLNKIQTETFLRDPFRAMYMDKHHFFSPADGIILYQRILKPTEKLVEVKGVHYDLQDMMEDLTFDKTCLVIGIFMTYADVHYNRAPYGGYMKYKLLSPTATYNRPMIFVEKNLFKNKLFDLYQNMDYIKTNARMLNTFYNPKLDYTFYLTQIADDEVNVITHFTTEQNNWFNQSERFSLIRWGSQVELILPIDKRYKFTPIWPDRFHVEASVDRILRIEKA